MRSVLSLLDEAIVLCGGNQSELARRLGMHPPDISQMKRGTRPITPEIVGELCALVGVPADEARQLAVQAVLDNPKNQSKREVLRKAFLVSLWGLGVGFGTLASLLNPSNAGAAPLIDVSKSVAVNTPVTDCLYIVARTVRRCICAIGRTIQAATSGAAAYPPAQGYRPWMRGCV